MSCSSFIHTTEETLKNSAQNGVTQLYKEHQLLLGNACSATEMVVRGSATNENGWKRRKTYQDCANVIIEEAQKRNEGREWRVEGGKLVSESIDRGKRNICLSACCCCYTSDVSNRHLLRRRKSFRNF